jgi:membrane-bound metal-dependent hydrolase YbcI (DUF457 family)
MFIGHFAVGFASKKVAPRASLLPLMAAPLLLDLLWPFFLLSGWEEVRISPGDTRFTPLEFVSYPLSHSLLTSLLWALLFALAYLAGTRYRRGSLVIALGVLSHWFLDALTHRPDLPLYPGSSRVGLGLWNSVAGTMIVESVMLAAGVWAYVSATRPRDKAGSYGFWSLVVVLVLLYLGNARGTPPPDLRTLILLSLGVWVLLSWAGWADRHRLALGDLPGRGEPRPDLHSGRGHAKV